MNDQTPSSTSTALEDQRPPLANRRWMMGAVAGAATLAGLGLASWQSTREPQSASQRPALWSLSFDTPGGRALHMQSLSGRPLLLNFWATWCPPCIEELPLLDLFFAQNSANGWQVLGLAVDQSAAVNTFLKRMPLQFPIALAGMPGIELSKNLGNLTGGLPFTVVLGTAGQILHRKMGRITTQDLQSWRTLQ